jgi:hypothetical protein
LKTFVREHGVLVLSDNDNAELWTTCARGAFAHAYGGACRAALTDATLHAWATRALDLNIGLGLLESFFSAIGATGIAAKIKAAYEHKGARAVRFKLKNATRDSMDVIEFGNALFDCRLKTTHAFVQRGNGYYVTVGVCRSPSITVSAEQSNQEVVTVEASAVKDAVSASGKINVKQEESLGRIHLFIAGPGAFAFYLGQRQVALGPTTLCEFDFEGSRGGSYELRAVIAVSA